MSRVCIPDYEYVERRKKCVEMMKEQNLDVMIVNGTESDYANPRYFCGFWPLFERVGVAIAANGNAAVMVGPESVIFAGDVSRIKNIYPCLYQPLPSASGTTLKPKRHNETAGRRSKSGSLPAAFL